MAGAEPRVMDVDDDGIRRIGARINLAQDEFAKRAGQLHTQLGNMHRDWQGGGGLAFGRLMAEWQHRQEQITRLLQTFEDSLSQTQRTSLEQDATQASSMFALNKTLNQQ